MVAPPGFEDVLTADGENVLSADGAQLIVREDPTNLPALSAIARCGASRCGASGRAGFIFINGVERTDDVDWRSLGWTEQTGGNPSQVTFNMKHDVGDDPPRPDQVFTLSIGTKENRKFFGNISKLTARNKHPTAAENARRYVVTATDSRRDANRRRVNGVFSGSASDVFLEIVGLAVPTFGTGGVQLGAPVVGEMSFKMVMLSDALDRLAERANWFWHMEGQEFFFYELTANAALPAKSLVEGEWGWYRDPPLAFAFDITQQRNRVFVEGSGTGLQARVSPGASIVPVTDGANFEAMVDLNHQGGYLNATTLMTTTKIDDWTQVGPPTDVVLVDAPVDEGLNAPAIRIDGSNADYLWENLIGHEDGPGIFSILFRDPLTPGSGEGRVEIVDVSGSSDITIADITIDATADPPTVTPVVGSIHRDTNEFLLVNADAGWWWFIFRPSVDLVAANSYEFRIYGGAVASPDSSLEFWGPMGQNTTAPAYQFSWFVPVDAFFLPRTAETVLLRQRELAYLENELIVYRFMYSGEVVIENWCAWSYELDNWTLAGNRTLVTADQHQDRDGNNTLDLVGWTGVGGASLPHTLGVESLPTVVKDPTANEATPGLFTMQIDASDLSPLATSAVRIGFWDPSTGTSLLDATQAVWATFDLTDGSVINSGAGSGNPQTVLTETEGYAGNDNWELRVAGEITGGWDWLDSMQCSIYVATLAGGVSVVPNTDGSSVYAGRVLLVTGIGLPIVLSDLGDFPILQTGVDPILLAEDADALFGVPGSGRVFSITRTHGDGTDINPILVAENQEAQLVRAETVALAGANADWLLDGPAEFYKRDRRLSAEGMLGAAQLELIRWLGPEELDYAQVAITYVTRDQTANIGSLVNFQVPVGWGVTDFTGTIVGVSTVFLKDGLQERTVEVALNTPRTFYDYLAQVKRNTVEQD